MTGMAFQQVPAGHPTITVLIATWNRKADVLETVRLVYEQDYRDFEIVVVDNGSTDGTAGAVRETFPGVNLVALDHNLGVCGGRNAGIVVARGEIILCLDSDAHPAATTMADIVARFRADQALGIINSKILNSRTGAIDATAGWAYTERQKEQQDSEFLAYTVSETGCAVRREVFEKVGLFWQELFFGREGMDLCLRAWDVGYKVLYFPRSVVYHRISHRERMMGTQRMYHDLRSLLMIYLVRYPVWVLVWMLPLTLAASLVKGAKRGDLSFVRRAVTDVTAQLGSLLRQRQPISTSTARLYLRMQREHGPLSWDVRSWLRYKT